MSEIFTKDEIDKHNQELDEHEAKIKKIVFSILNEEEGKEYLKLSTDVGVIMGLIKTLKSEGILNSLGEESSKLINDSIGNIIQYSRVGMESKLGKVQSNLLISEMEKNNLF